MSDKRKIKPQPRQEEFLASPADIAIIGGAAGGGKTWALLVEPLRHIKNPRFSAAIFRRTTPELTRPGGAWVEAREMYPLLNAIATSSPIHAYTFPTGATVTFSHLQREADVETWKSSQIPLIEFDQLETFEASQFWYMLSRNRSTCGIRPYIRASANPQPGWLADFLAWWIGEDGFAIPERSGKIRWMVREGGRVFWDDDREKLQAEHPRSTPLSVTFVLSTLYDNPILMQKDPDYLAKLQALDLVERERLLGDAVKGGNWKIAPAAGKIFNRAWYEIVEAVPAGGKMVRFWDLAATVKKAGNDPDFTASCLMKKVEGVYYILEATADQISPSRTDANMKNSAIQDGKPVRVRWEEEGGASGKRDSQHIAKNLAGFDACGRAPKGDKLLRWKPFAAQAEAGNVKLLRGDWNERWLAHMHSQEGKPTQHDDEADAGSGAFDELTDEEQEVRATWLG